MDMSDYAVYQQSLAAITEMTGVVFPNELLAADVLKGTTVNERIPVRRQSDMRLRRKAKK